MLSAHRTFSLTVLALLMLGIAAFAACSGGGGSSPVIAGSSGTMAGTSAQNQVLQAAAKVTPSPKPGASPTPTASPSSLCFMGSPPTPGPVTPSAPPVRLSSYNIDPSKVFVAGISSGGFFAVDMHVAHSATFKGAAIYAGGVYWCAQDSVGLALAECGGATAPNCQAAYASTLTQSEAYLDLQSKLGTIDNESNLRGQPVYMWEGTHDQVVNPSEMVDLKSEYEHYGANVTFDNGFPANHGWESPDGSVPCGVATDPYMIACDQGSAPYDSEKTWLTLFFGRLHDRNNHELHGSLLNFDQTEFGASPSTGMDTNGYIFVPHSCAEKHRCGVVLAFHGCRQVQAAIQTQWIKQAGINEWADSNNFVVVYPYAILSTVNPTNPQGCWDWWGYDNDPSYANKNGVQIGIIYKMIQRIDPSAPN